MNYKKFIFTVISITLLNNVAFGADEWDQIIKHEVNQLSKIKLTEKNNKIHLIAHSHIYFKHNSIQTIDNFLTEEYDPILMSMYLSYALNENIQDPNLLQRLTIFYNKENDNGLACFYLSYYYAINSDYILSLKYLKEANNRKKFYDYDGLVKKIVYKYSISNTNNEIFAYSSAMVFDNDLLMILRRMSNKLIQGNSSDFKKEMYEIGKKIELKGNTLIKILLSIGIQIDCIDKENNSALYSDVIKRHYYLFNLQDNLEGKTGKKELLIYLKSVYSLGEVKALEQLSYNN